jgi:membrane-associated phospholipid phosphatase
MYNILRKNSIFLISFFVFFFAGLISVLLYTKADIHLYLNRFHSPFFDIFFKYVTYIGSGYAAILICFILLFLRVRYAMILFASWAITGIIVQILKHFAFPEFDRPVEYFRTIAELYLVQGIKIHKHFTIPSGHAATAMAIFGLIAMISKRPWVKFIVGLSAWIVSYSRVYLSQHFLQDILVGSLLGIIAVIIFYWYFHRLKITWADQPVHHFFQIH